MLRTMIQSNATRQLLMLSIFAGVGAAPIVAQTAVTAGQAQDTVQTPTIDATRNAMSSSSSSADAGDGLVTEASVHAVGPNFSEMMQYGGRQRYGRPRYRGGNTNPDGSEKYTFFAGVGFTQPVGNTYHYLTPSYGFQVGGGRNFDKTFGLMAQFDYDNFGFNARTLGNQSNVYNNTFGPGAVSGLDGNSHVWSFTVDPTVSIYSGAGLGAYVVGGAGFYHKTANFQEPAAGLCYDVYYGYYQCTANQTIDKYTSNAPGFNGGLGLTYKFSRFSNERFYVEARYVFVDNSQRKGVTVATASPAQQNQTDFYPANSNRTTYVPVKVGVRF